MTQNVSSKMLRSWMIRNRQSITYNTSASDTIVNIITGADEASNKKLLFSIGYEVYERYYNIVAKSPKLSINEKYDVQDTFYKIISGLSDGERRQLGIYQETEDDVSNALQAYETNIVLNPDFTFYCSVYDNNKFKSLVIKNMQGHYKLTPGKKYIFNLEHETNIGTTLSFSKKQQLFEDVGGIYRVGTPGTSGACLVFIPEASSYYYSVYIYNKEDYTRGSFADFGYIYEQLYLEYSYKLPYPNNSLFSAKNENVTNVPLFGDSLLHIVENQGPKYLLTSDASYSQIITDPSYVSYSWYEYISLVKQTFGMYYGYYKLSYRFTGNRVALINKGTTSYGVSMENLIQVYGSSARDVETHYLEGLDETGELDGYYNFYYTPLTIKVLGDFEKCSLYTSILGYNQLDDLLFFDGKYSNYSIQKPGGYTDISVVNIIGLYPESCCHFHDISSDSVSLARDVSVNDRPRISLNYIDGDSYNPDIIYGLYKGQYIIKNIPEDRPIAIINIDQNNSKEKSIKYFGPQDYKKTRLGPDGKTTFDFFYNTLIIQVFGDFGKVSIYEYNDGFCGSENLLTYNEAFSDISNEFQSWYEIYEDADFSADLSGVVIDGSNIDVSYSNIYQVSSYINGDVGLDDAGKKTIIFDDISATLTKYCFDTGNFVLMDVSSSNPIAFLNKDREDLFSYDGYYAYSTTNTASDGNTYTYYYGNINITVAGDFGQLSFETLRDGYMGGYRKLMYNSGNDNTKGLAVHHWGVNTYYDMLTSDSSGAPQNYYINVRTNTRTIHYSEDYVTYRFAGYDRNGVIDSESDNPELTFAIGDIIYFSFDDNSEHPFGIYTYHNLLDNQQLVTSNSNNTNLQTSWIPNLVMTNYYYYRSEKYVTNFMSNTITIINNENAEIVLDISDVYTDPLVGIDYSAGSTPLFQGATPFSILTTSFIINFDEVTNINSSKNLYLYNKTTDTIDATIPGTKLKRSNDLENSIIYQTEFTKYNVSSLEFDTSYSLLMDEELFQNIYYNTISGEIEAFLDISAYNLLDFTTEPRHEPTLISISTSSTDSFVDVSGYITLEFNEPVTVPDDADVPGNNNISFIDGDNNSIDYSYDVSSGNCLYIYYSGLTYNTSYSVVFDQYSVVDSSNIEFTIADSSLSDYSIHTIGDPKPQLQYFTPNNDISNIYVDQPITLVFNENVYLDTSGNGQIKIDAADGGDALVPFNYLDISVNNDVSGIIFGEGTNTLRIYPFNADASFANNTIYFVSINSETINDICDNYYPGVAASDSSTITFTTGAAQGSAQESLNNETSGNIVSDNAGNNYIVFNADTEHDFKQYTLSVGRYILDISDSYPITIMNANLSERIQIDISNDVIEIDVSGGSLTADASTGDYFLFTTNNGESVSLANGDFKFMRGQTYKFIDSGIIDNYEFVLYYDASSVSLTEDTSSVTFKIPEDTSTNSLYYCVKYTTTDVYGNNPTTSKYDASLTLLYTEISESNENGNGFYDFYYGNVIVDVCGNDFGSLSFYTYNNGYMGGKYAFTFEDNYSG